MATVTVNETDAHKFTRRLEDVTITNQVANSTTVRKAVRVPDTARSASFYILMNSMGGTSPLFDFIVEVPDFYDPNAIVDDPLMGIGEWNGITQLTAAVQANMIIVDIGPGITGIADDDTGSATADTRYAINAPLPSVLSYAYTTDGTTDDEDYDFELIVVFKR